MSSTDSKNINTETSYPAIVGKVMADVRKKCGLDQTELARAVGVNQPTWSRIENGTSAFTLAQLQKAADRLDMTAAEILSKADAVSSELRKRGIKVHNDVIQPSSLSKSNIFALIGGAALGALVTAVLMTDKDDDDGKELPDE